MIFYNLFLNNFFGCTENSSKDNNNNDPQPTATATTKCKDNENDSSVDPAEDDKSGVEYENELNNIGIPGNTEGEISERELGEGALGEGQMEQESTNYSTELIEIKSEQMWSEEIGVNREPSVHFIDVIQQSESASEVWSVAGKLSTSNGSASKNQTESNGEL